MVLSKHLHRLREDQRGTVAVIMGFLIIPLVGALGIGFEVSNWYLKARGMQNAADSAALTAAINWYRAMPLIDIRALGTKVTVPTMYVWSDGDTALLRNTARGADRYVTGEYRFEILHGVSHWMLDEEPETVADLLLEWFATHPA